jgi:hypothetical protein
MQESGWMVVTTYGRTVLREFYHSFAGAAARAAWLLDYARCSDNLAAHTAVTVVEVEV